MLATLLTALSFVTAAMTAASFVPIAHGIVRVCDFPRLQILAVAAVLLALTLAFVPLLPLGVVLLAIQVPVVCVQAWICLRFTPLWPVQSLAPARGTPRRAAVRIIAANVKMSNRAHSRLSDLLRRCEPDIVLLMEVDKLWLAALEAERERFPHRVEQPQDNTYGMALLSRLPLRDTELRFLLMPAVPSIRTAVVLPDGRAFRLHVLHPEPPVPFEDTLGRDGELILTARDVAADSLPVVVAGDLNDVAWSRTTRRFQRLTGLLDPRIGRGFFNSFDARYPLLRWSLDHLFHDPQFRLLGVRRLPHIGSDHFPMEFDLVLADEEAAGPGPGEPDADDVEEAGDVAADARDLDRKAVGSDWED